MFNVCGGGHCSAVEAARTAARFILADRRALLERTATAAQGGRYELYESTETFDSTARHPAWLG